MKPIYTHQPLFKRIKNFSLKTWIIAAAVVLALIITATILFPKPPAIATVPVVKGEFVMDLGTSGEIEALNSVDVSIPRFRRRMTLQIVDMAEEGAIVKKGDFLFQLDQSEALQRKDDALNKLANAEAQLESEKASIASNKASLISQFESQKYSYQQAELNLRAMQFEADARKKDAELNLKKAGLALEQAEERIKSQEIIDRATLARAELNVSQARNDLKEAEDALEQLRIMAPIDGLVVYKEIFSGGSMKKVQIGDTPFWGMPVIGIPDLSAMIAKTTVNEVDISRVERGQNAVITVDALDGRNYYGKITRVAALARRESVTNARVFDIEIEIDATDQDLRPGMTSSIRIITGRLQDVLSVPLQSVFEKDGRTIVYVMGARRWSEREVKVGRRGQDRIVILEGLDEGEMVCLRDPTIPLDEIGTESEAAASRQQTRPQAPARESGQTRMIMF